MEEDMDDPCKNCLVEPLGCEQMCPEIIEFYSKRIKKRSKKEIEKATGYIWDEQLEITD